MTKEEFESIFKEGDVLVVRHWVFLLHKLGEEPVYFPGCHPYLYHAIMYKGDEMGITVPDNPIPGIGWLEEEGNEHPRMATNDERDELFTRLEHEGYMWDNINKTLIKKG